MQVCIPRQSFRHWAQKGLALWDTLLLVILLGGFLLVAFILFQSRTVNQLTEDRAATLAWADSKLVGFAASQMRLPCPDVNNDGLEDCALGNVTGLLPIRTLGLDSDSPSRGPIQINYSVHRQAPLDLTLLNSQYEPVHHNGILEAYGVINGLDYCLKLGLVTAALPTANAFSISLNPLATQAAIAASQTPQALARVLSCTTTIASVNALALATDVVTEVQTTFDDHKAAAEMMIIWNAINVVITGIQIVVSAMVLAAAITTLGLASAALAGAVASCIVLVGCAFIPVYTAAVTAASIAIGLSAAAVALNALTLIPLGISIGLAVAVANMAGSSSTVPGFAPPPGNPGATLVAQLAQLLATAITLESDAALRESEATTAENLATASAAAAVTARQDALNAALAGTEVLVTTALDAAETLATANQSTFDTKAAYDLAVDLVTDLTGALADANAAITANPTQTWRVTVRDQIQADLTTAIADRNAKFTAYQTALTTEATALSDFETARNTAANAQPGFNQAVMLGLINDYYDKFFKAERDALSAITARQLAIDTRASAVEARAAYVSLNCQLNPPAPPVPPECLLPPAPTSTTATVWTGADAVLRQADQNGVVE